MLASWLAKRADAHAADCHGCSLCLLPCPMWRQHRDVMFSPQGMCKSMQAQAKAEDVRAVLETCVNCGACDVICPEHIDVTGIMDRERDKLGLPKAIKVEEQALTAFMMSCDPAVQAQLHADDLYIIDAAVLHQHYAERITHYTTLRQETGCQFNLDLNRLAIPTGAASQSAQDGRFDVAEQVGWLMQGRTVARVVVENTQDGAAIAEYTDIPVVYIADLMPVNSKNSGVQNATS